MANKTQFLASLAARDEILAVGTANFVDVDSAGVALYQVQVFETNDAASAGLRKTVHFYVTDDGGASETCFEFRTELKKELSPEQQFTDICLDYIYAESLANLAELVTVDNNRKKIRVKLYKESDSTNATVREAIIWQNNGNPPQVRYLS
jgi:hypothetical protein